jgi:hypothetical protein
MPHEREFGWPGGDVPGDIQFEHRADDRLTQVLTQTLVEVFSPIGPTGSVVSLRGLQDWPTAAGSYKLTTDAGAWFVRLSTRLGNAQLERDITTFLADSNVSVSSILATGRFEWEGQSFRGDIRHVIEGRHFGHTLSDLSSVARTLGRCHDALESFPRWQDVKHGQSERMQRHVGVRSLVEEAVTKDNFEVFHEREEWARENREWLAAMVEYYDPTFHEYPGAQCVHGEIHPANVVFPVDRDDEATLVDFETSIHTFAPRAWDLAYFVQRFALRDDPSSSNLVERKSVIEQAYGSPLPPLSMMMRQTSWYCIACAVSNRISLDMIAPLSEYRKFVRLERQARELMDWL